MKLSLPQVAVFTVSILVAAGCARLGFWQLDRLDQRQAYNLAVREAMQRPPLNLDQFADSILLNPDDYLYRPAIASGEILPSRAVLLRGRTDAGRPGVHLVVPLRLDDGRFLLVNRGWIPAADAASADPRPWLSEPFEARGILQQVPVGDVESQPLSVEVGDTTIRTYRRLDQEDIAPEVPGPLLPLYLEVVPEAAPGEGLPIPVPLSTLDEGPHFGYAVQWFSFALIALLGPAVFTVVRRGSRPPE